MSGVLKTLSMEDLEGQQGQGDSMVSGRSLGNGQHSRPQSPLKFFSQAKKTINDIFKEILEYINESRTFLAEHKDGSEEKKHVEEFQGMVRGIIEVLARDHMKCCFFGRTSNGKSSVINAMLRKKILPSGIGHTTNCFLQVEGCDGMEGCLYTEESDEPKSVNSVKQLASALSTAKLKENSLIRILWPKEKCRLLKEDVVFLDSPGIDVTPDLDDWIDKFCLDADVFVLVANSESTLMRTEKNFFHKVSDRLSKPNIFILQNRWDVSVLEEDTDIESVKEQHYQRNVEFLCDELKVANTQEAKNRIYFVSAKEALISRLHEDNQTPTPTGSLQRDFTDRLFEFANFERMFEVCISKSAVKTKFEQHAKKGKTVNSNLREVMEKTYTDSLHQMEESIRVRQETADELDYLEKQLTLLTGDIKDKIRFMVDDVERKVSTALSEEIRRLSSIVDEFERPFHPDQVLLNAYKKELHLFVEGTVCQNLTGRCSTAIEKTIERVETQLTERIAVLLPEETKQQLYSLVPRRDFEIAYRLDCRNLCADFQEDIQFRFSVGLTALMQRFLGKRGTHSVLTGHSNTIPRPMSEGGPQTPIGEFYRPLAPEQNNQVLISMITTFASITSRTTMGAIIVGGLIAKAAGWKVIVVTSGLYGLLYMYERLTWTNKAKERAFKRQYVDYASSKLKLIVDLTSANCSHQVQQELSSTFARLCNQVDLSKNKLQGEIGDLDKSLAHLKEISAKAKLLRNKSDWLDKQLNGFIEEFLVKPDA
ncbi:mitofusin-2-like isoform X2 [Mizuhopecten yessoensis]|uniref:Mitofusin-2 n=1 Tax=Mizuhopecten yessoensis TaxID=6573 RepID=A0A210R562_MIZYE|nr:mitofusin-2-like isoform X2 [Mizuhopecten yessoensis]OWF56197.1 Mitofusin-2 [Mizuhopecten yessoensis]